MIPVGADAAQDADYVEHYSSLYMKEKFEKNLAFSPI